MQSNPRESSDCGETRADELDHALDAALAKYAAVEPRSGLEQRILARMQSEQQVIPTHSLWQWSAVSAVALALVIMTGLTLRSNKPAKSMMQQHPAGTIETVTPSSMFSASAAPNTARRLKALTVRPKPPRSHRSAVVASGPKLEQFPSPKPLTTEELALVRYVKEFPRDAVMVARAQDEFEKETEREAAAGR